MCATVYKWGFFVFCSHARHQNRVFSLLAGRIAPARGGAAFCTKAYAMPYVILFFAVLAETIATSALQASHQFTRLWPSVAVVLGYGVSFWFMALALKYMNVGVVYAIWSGMGIVLIAIIGYVVFHQSLDLPALLGLAMIIAGIVVIQLFSSTVSH